jgi:DNA invertase Pin-like site-specific DNA recombinase
MTFKVKRQNLKKIKSKYKISEQENWRKKILHTYVKKFSRSYESIGRKYNVSRVTVYRIICRYLMTLSTERRLGSGRKGGPANPKLA